MRIVTHCSARHRSVDLFVFIGLLMHAFRFFCIERCLFRVFCTERSMPRHTNSDKHVLLKRQPSLNVHCHVPITLGSCALPHQIIQVSLIFGSPVDRLHTIGYTASSHCSYFFIMCILCLIDFTFSVLSRFG